MPTSPAILIKIKLLLALTKSPNPHEADSARQLANKLIEKHGVSAEELESIKDKKPLYGDEDKLFSTIGIVSWKQQLALCVATHCDCQIVQEELVPIDGPHPFHYYMYGDAEAAKKVRLAFHAFAAEVERLVDSQCLGENADYIDSYSEGVVESIKQNILLYGIDVPEVRKPLQPEAITIKSEEMVKPKENRPAPAEKKVDVKSQSMVKNIEAYFIGIYDGRELFLDEIIEIAITNQPAPKLTEEND